MTDLELLKAMFDRAGVLYTHPYCGNADTLNVAENASSQANKGYFGFVTDFIFNEDGSLKSVGAYE